MSRESGDYKADEASNDQAANSQAKSMRNDQSRGHARLISRVQISADDRMVNYDELNSEMRMKEKKCDDCDVMMKLVRLGNEEATSVGVFRWVRKRRPTKYSLDSHLLQSCTD